jgi:drug/metabolite transporter (DMT)-like permease
VVVAAALGAVVTALCYGVAAVLQAVAMREGAPGESLDARVVVRMLSRLPYLAGLALDGLGFLASLLALRHLPLFLVQAAVAASVGITALLADRFLGVALGRAQWAVLAALATGVVLLAISAEPGGASSLSRPGQWAVLIGVAPLSVLGIWGARPGRGGAPLLALVSGAAYGGVGIAARALPVSGSWWHLAAEPLTYAVVGYGAVGTVLFAAGLERGSVTVVVAVLFAVETVVPAAVGLAVLGDTARSGLAAVAVLGFVITVGSALLLAGFAQPAESRKAAAGASSG